jgi:hypothetical protein
VSRPIQPQNPAELAAVDRKHALVSGIVDRLTAEVRPQQQDGARRWLEFVDPIINEISKAPGDGTSTAIAIACEALSRLTP